MPSLREIGQQNHKLKLVCDHLSKYPSVDGNYTLDETGEINRVLLSDTSVIKIPRSNENRRDVDQEVGAASFEAMLVDKVHDVDKNDEKSPLALPETHDAGLDYSYAMFSRVPGEVLTREQAREFSPAEKAAYGWKLGLFVAWMAKAISFEQYGEIFDLYKLERPDRGTALRIQAGFQAYPGFKNLPEPVGKILLDIHAEYEARLKDGSLDSTIIGHEDLGERNLTFTRPRHLGRWALYGVFDFGLTKPSSPERELRNLATLSQGARDAGIAAYESKTGERLSRELIQFWAVAQTVTNLSAAIRKGDPVATERKRKDLQTLLPKEKL